MLSNDFAQKHRLCEFGLSQLGMNENRDLKEMWFDESMPTSGTILMWIASRAQYDKKALLRCTAECVREAADLAPAAEPRVRAAIDRVLGWNDGSSTRDDVDRVTHEALENAKAAGKRADGAVERQLWAAVSTLSRCVRSVSCCSGTVSATVKAAEAAGQSGEEWQKRLAARIRTMLPWGEVESAIAAEKTSPRPRQKTPDEVAAESQRILGEFEKLLGALAESRQQKEAVFSSLGAAPDRISAFVQSGKLGPKNQAILQEELQKLDADAASTATSPKSGAAPARRPRMIV